MPTSHFPDEDVATIKSLRHIYSTFDGHAKESSTTPNQPTESVASDLGEPKETYTSQACPADLRIPLSNQAGISRGWRTG
jgi:hypothetical protein